MREIANPPRPTPTRRLSLTRAQRVALTLIALAVLMLASACRPPGDGTSASGASASASVSVELLTTPARVGPAAFEVVLTRDGMPVEGASVTFTGDMTHAGMVPVVADAIEIGDGVYRSDGFAFDMAGDWVVTVDVTHPDGERERGSLATSVGR